MQSDDTIRPALAADLPALTDLFWTNLRQHPDYISHGEMQMGIASGTKELLPDGKTKWTAYADRMLRNPHSEILVCESGGHLTGFTIVEIVHDGDKPFGVVCDLLVDPAARGSGVGSALLRQGMEWLRNRGIEDFYLESGIGNHKAHDFFQRSGFEAVSYVFKLLK